MIAFNNVSTLMASTSIPECVKNDVLATLGDCIVDGCEYDDAVDNFSSFFGGQIYYVEVLEDLKEISTYKKSDDGRYKSLFDTADSFDSARFIDEDVISVFTATNNAGGPCYYIPKSVYSNCKNVEESISLTEALWRSANEDNPE
jgi:hypothetical protein